MAVTHLKAKSNQKNKGYDKNGQHRIFLEHITLRIFYFQYTKKVSMNEKYIHRNKKNGVTAHARGQLSPNFANALVDLIPVWYCDKSKKFNNLKQEENKKYKRMIENRKENKKIIINTQYLTDNNMKYKIKNIIDEYEYEYNSCGTLDSMHTNTIAKIDINNDPEMAESKTDKLDNPSHIIHHTPHKNIKCNKIPISTPHIDLIPTRNLVINTEINVSTISQLNPKLVLNQEYDEEYDTVSQESIQRLVQTRRETYKDYLPSIKVQKVPKLVQSMFLYLYTFDLQ